MCGVFIAPLGRENDYLFASEEGNFYLQSEYYSRCAIPYCSSKYSRLIVVTLNHLHKFGTIEDIQKELSPKIMSLVPEDCVNRDKIPYLKIGDNIGQRVTVCNQNGIIVEDVADFDGAIIRRLFFESKIEQVQSEVNLRSIPKGSDPAMSETKSTLFPENPKSMVAINHKVLCSDYARAIVAGLAAIGHVIISKPKFRVTILGTGAGSLSMFFKQNIANAVVDTVDSDSSIIDIGKTYFGFHPDDRLVSHCVDAEKYMKALYARKEPNPYDLVVVDLNNPDFSTGINPGPAFLSKEFLTDVKVRDTRNNLGRQTRGRTSACWSSTRYSGLGRRRNMRRRWSCASRYLTLSSALSWIRRRTRFSSWSARQDSRWSPRSTRRRT